MVSVMGTPNAVLTDLQAFLALLPRHDQFDTSCTASAFDVHVFRQTLVVSFWGLSAGTKDDWLTVLSLGYTATLLFDPHNPFKHL